MRDSDLRCETVSFNDKKHLGQGRCCGNEMEPVGDSTSFDHPCKDRIETDGRSNWVLAEMVKMLKGRRYVQCLPANRQW